MKQIPRDEPSLLVIDRGEELINSLDEFWASQRLRSAWLTGLGAAAQVELGFYDLNLQDYHWQTFEQPLEIVSLTGNLSLVDDRPFWHIHGVFSDSQFQVYAGHVRRLSVGLTLEIHISPLPSPLTRKYSGPTGLKLLDSAD